MKNKLSDDIFFGEWVRQQRHILDLTQQELADRVGYARITLRRIEAGTLKPSKGLAEILLKELGVPSTTEAWLRFARGISGLPSQSNSGSKQPTSNLPVSLTTFIGRQKEQSDVIRLIAKHRLVTLTGVGGIGKTRLSIQTASALLDDFPNGVWLVELAPLSDSALVAQTIVNTLGLLEQANRAPQIVLTDFLQSKHALLILDNCEHLIQACAQLVETLLRTCPELHILATSRERLGIAGEITFSIPTLSFPNIDQQLSTETLTQYEAVQLFVQRTTTVLPSFSITMDNASALAGVCRQLDGIPLALELAAARMKLLRVEELAARLHDRFQLLTSGSRTALPRHQTLQAMIDWSHDLLTEPERVVLRRLSVFAGGWTLEAAEAVCIDEVQGGILPHQVLDLLTQLVNKSLILVEHKQGHETRYHMLETIRQYARDRLWEAGEGEILRQHHLMYFVELAERAEPNLRAFDMIMWLDRLEAELDNIRVGLEWAQESDIEAQLRLASALLWFWHIRGHKNEGVDWLERGLSIEATERGDKPLTPDRAMIRGKALNVAGFLLAILGEIEKAEPFSEAALALFQNLGSMGKQGMAYALWNKASIADQQRDVRPTKALLKECLALFQQTGDKFGLAQCIHALGYCAIDEGDYEQARTLLDEHLALREKIGDKDGIAIAYLSLGDLAAQLGNYRDAVTHCEASLALFQEIRNRGAISLVLYRLGNIARALGDYGQASTLIEEALRLGQDLGDRVASASLLNELGLVAGSQGDYGRATQLYEDALTVFRAVGDPFRTADVLCNLGLVALAQGDYQHALEKFEEALAISEKVGHHYTTAFAHYCIARAVQAQGDLVTARELVFKAIAIFHERSDPADVGEGVAHCLEACAILAIKENQMKRASCLFSAAEKLYPPLRFVISAKERGEHDQAIAITRAALDEETFAAAYKEGKQMPLDEAIAYALKED